MMRPARACPPSWRPYVHVLLFMARSGLPCLRRHQLDAWHVVRTLVPGNIDVDANTGRVTGLFRVLSSHKTSAER